MKVLVINCGSSSLKFKLYDLPTADSATMMAEGLVEEIGREKSRFSYRDHRSPDKIVGDVVAKDHTQAVAAMKDMLLDDEHGLFKNKIEVDACGHRVVHGRELFSNSALITPEVRTAIEECIGIAPLHNPPNLAGIAACEKIFPGLPQVAVFDTAFHQTMPPHVFLYGLPHVLYQRHAIRRYGFHGTSHRYVYGRLEELQIKRGASELRAITMHLGNGCSMAAIRGGKSMDTTMGLTPLEGLIMGTRCGDIDPAVVLHLMAAEDINMNDVNTLLNKHSGLLGVSGVSNDMREIVKAAKEGHEMANTALNMFCYRIKKYIGAYTAALNGVDAIVFTGGIGENGIDVRTRVCAEMDALGIRLNEKRNAELNSKEALISADDSRVAIWIIPTNEEIVIARDTALCVDAARQG